MELGILSGCGIKLGILSGCGMELGILSGFVFYWISFRLWNEVGDSFRLFIQLDKLSGCGMELGIHSDYHKKRNVKGSFIRKYYFNEYITGILLSKWKTNRSIDQQKDSFGTPYVECISPVK
jgi:hypothetical protein